MSNDCEGMVKHIKGFYPMWQLHKDFVRFIGEAPDKSATFYIALERGDGQVKRHDVKISTRKDAKAMNFAYVERVVKFMMWAFGGYKVYFSGDKELANAVASQYKIGGAREFDYVYMTNVYRKELTFEVVEKNKMPKECGKPITATNDTKGCRIGFDAGGSDRKVTAIKDGVTVFEDETVWSPKTESDPAYHRAGIDDSIDRALACLGNHVDAIGISSAGILVDGEVRVASLFHKVPQEIYAKEVFPIYTRLATKYGCPVKIANDGDVTALAGAYQLGKGKVLGTAMGTSLAGGYIDSEMRITGWLNELAFVPVDANTNAATDEWSGDYGVGGVYLSQDGIIRLAEECGFDLSAANTLGEKLKIVQGYANAGDETALEIYKDIGTVFGYSILWFSLFYDIDFVMFLGRVASGKGGDALLRSARAVIRGNNKKIRIFLPDEMTRRLGQSFTAALM